MFVCDRRTVERLPRRARDAVLGVLRRDAQQLVRLRHPCLLSVEHPLEEAGDTLAFATDRVTATLAVRCARVPASPSPRTAPGRHAAQNILPRHAGVHPVPFPPKEYALEELDIQLGLLQVAQALAFLHDAKLVHGNVTPDAVVLDRNGDWRLVGFGFAHSAAYTTAEQGLYALEEGGVPAAMPALDYLAPEYVFDKASSAASDMFSFGVLAHAVFTGGRPVMEFRGSPAAYRQGAGSMANQSLADVPAGMRDAMRRLLSMDPGARPSASSVATLPYFDTVSVLTLRYLDALMEKEEITKAQFLKGLHRILGTFSVRVCVQKVLPPLRRELLVPRMVPFVLPNILLVGERLDRDAFMQHVLPCLLPVLAMQEPVQILLIIMQNMGLLLSRVTPEAARDYVLPVLFRALESPSVQIQELCVNVIPSFAAVIDYSQMRHALLPRLLQLASKADSPAVIVNTLVCISKILDMLDKSVIEEKILPLLEQISSSEPGILMAVLGLYDQIAKSKRNVLEVSIIATRILPHLLPRCIQSTLNEKQFTTFMSVIKSMLNHLEQEHVSRLRQTAGLQEQARSIGAGDRVPAAAATVTAAPATAAAAFADHDLQRMEQLMLQSNRSQPAAPALAVVLAPRTAPAAAATAKDEQLFAKLFATAAAAPAVGAAAGGVPTLLDSLNVADLAAAPSRYAAGAGAAATAQPPAMSSSMPAAVALPSAPARPSRASDEIKDLLG